MSMGLRKGPILPIVQTNGPHNPQVKTGKCNCRRQGALIVAGGRRPERVNERHLRRSDHFFQVRGPVSGAPAREAGEVGANPTHLTTAAEDKLAESPACRAGDNGGSTRRPRHFLPPSSKRQDAGPRSLKSKCESWWRDHFSGDSEIVITPGLHPGIPGANPGRPTIAA